MTIDAKRNLSEEHLDLLLKLSQALSASLDLDDVLKQVIDSVIQVTKAERGFVMLFADDEQLEFSAARGVDKKTIENPETEISRSVVDSVVSSGKPLLTSDAQEEMNTHGSVMRLHLRSVLCVPLSYMDRITGVIYVDSRVQTNLFTEKDLDLLNAVAVSAAIAIENACLYQLAVEKGRMERELQVARRVQAGLIPEKTPAIEGWEVAAYWDPAREVAGDYYDFIPRGDKTGVVIADVVDKGMAAALFMTYSRSILRTSLRGAETPCEAVTQMNQTICEDDSYGMFVTLVYLELDTSPMIKYVNAGHNPPMYYSAANKTITDLTRTGMLVGIMDDAQFDTAELQLAQDDCIVLFTDGINEAINQAEEEYGMARFRESLNKLVGGSAQEILAGLLKDYGDFVGDLPQFDDVSLLVIKRTGK